MIEYNAPCEVAGIKFTVSDNILYASITAQAEPFPVRMLDFPDQTTILASDMVDAYQECIRLGTILCQTITVNDILSKVTLTDYDIIVSLQRDIKAHVRKATLSLKKETLGDLAMAMSDEKFLAATPWQKVITDLYRKRTQLRQAYTQIKTAEGKE